MENQEPKNQTIQKTKPINQLSDLELADLQKRVAFLEEKTLKKAGEEE